MSFRTDGHLGGYVIGGDDATYYPDLWEWLVNRLYVWSVLDVGCGEGHAMRYFETVPVVNPAYPDLVQHPTVRGIDGIPQPDWRIYEHDFTTGPFTADSLMAPVPEPLPHAGSMRWRGVAQFDLIWACEFVEHVDEQYLPNFLETFRLGKYVAMTHADPGQEGYHHVNCRPAVYWVGALAAIGFHYDAELTSAARGYAAFNTNPYNHFVRSGLVFARHV